MQQVRVTQPGNTRLSEERCVCLCMCVRAHAGGVKVFLLTYPVDSFK